jgi:hypothetical protein
MEGGIMRHSTWQYLIDWISRMANKYDGIVYDHNGKRWDWGQAICREMYGEDWMHHEEFERIDNLEDTKPVPDEVIGRAIEWENGKWPEWVDKVRMGFKEGKERR